MKKRFYRLFLSATGIAAVLLCNACIREKAGDCSLNVTLHMQLQSVEQRHLTNLQSVSVFVFDGEGLFLERHNIIPVWESDFSYRMKVPIEQEGAYQFVIWTNADDPTYNVTDCERSSTRLGDASLEIRCGGDAVVSDLPAMLCYGHHAPVEIQTGENDLYVRMKRYTSMVQVVVIGLDEDVDHSVCVDYGSRNYRFDEQEHESTVRTFEPVYGSRNEGELVADFRLVRLNEGRESTLKVTDEGTKSDRLSLDLIDEVLAKYPGVDFSNQFEFLIEITLRNYIPIRIKVNDWVIVDEEV